MIVIIGCGTLGSRVAEIVSGSVVFVDFDRVEPRNVGVQRFSEKEIGKLKAEILALRHGGRALTVFIDHTNLDLLKEAEIIVDCTDNLLTRKLLGAYCFSQGIPLVHGAAARDRGVACLFDGKPCLASLYAGKVSVDTCRSTDIEPAVADLVAQKQAYLVHRALDGEGHDGVYLLSQDNEQVVQLSEKTFERCTSSIPAADFFITFCTTSHCMAAKPVGKKKLFSSSPTAGTIDGIDYRMMPNGEIHFFTEAEVDQLQQVAENILRHQSLE